MSTIQNIYTYSIGAVLVVAMLLSTMVFPGTTMAAHEGTQGYATVDRAVYSKLLTDINTILESISEGLDDDSLAAVVPTTETKATDLRVGLNGLMKEHVNLGMIALYNVIDNAGATGASVEALDKNSLELAATVGSVYGEDAEAVFLQIWRDHIGFFANYATGLRTNDTDLRAEANEDLKDYQQEVATFFNSALPNIAVATVVAGAGEHKDLLIAAMDAYADGEFADAYQAQREADKQISGIANLLAKEIVEQNPNLF